MMMIIIIIPTFEVALAAKLCYMYMFIYKDVLHAVYISFYFGKIRVARIELIHNYSITV